MSRGHVLIIDDEVDFTELAREVLVPLGYTVTALNEAPPEPSAVVSLAPDVLIVDVLLSGASSGWDVIDAVVAAGAAASIGVIACSAAHQEVAERREWLESNGVDVLLKPFALDELEAAVTRARAALGSSGLWSATEPTLAAVSNHGEAARELYR